MQELKARMQEIGRNNYGLILLDRNSELKPSYKVLKRAFNII